MAHRVVLLSNLACLEHKTGAGHPENGERLVRVLADMRAAYPPEDATSAVQWMEAPKGDASQVCLVHSRRYYDDLAQTIAGMKMGDAPVNIDVDTKVSAGSLDAALYGVGAACKAVDLVLDGAFKHAFCLTRPPGHHALKDSSMGFCLFGNAAIAAAYALERADVRKVAVIDFDVHQGNGTQDLIKDNPDILLVSLHQDDIWPYEHSEDRGVHGNILNIGVPKLSDPQFYKDAFEHLVMPKLREWAPDLVVLSAGFDAHRDDPPKGDEALFNDAAGRQLLLEEDFEWMTRQLLSVGSGRSVSILEGGYSADVLAKCGVSHVRALSAVD